MAHPLVIFAAISFICLLALIIKHMKTRRGHLIVEMEGEAEILLPFQPRTILVEFDDDGGDPSPSCAPPVPDCLDSELIKTDDGYWAIFIKWKVSQRRRVLWQADRASWF